jgi:hypothetical protein
MRSSIAEYNGVKPMNPMFLSGLPTKSYVQAPIMPRVTHALGSELDNNVGQARIRGMCWWNGQRSNKPLFRDPKTRLVFPIIQGYVVDKTQVPPPTYGRYTQKVSPNIVL